MNKIVNYIMPVITGILGFGLGYKFAMKNAKNALIENEKKLNRLKTRINSIYGLNSVNKDHVKNYIKSIKKDIDDDNNNLEMDVKVNEEHYMYSDSAVAKGLYDISEQAYAENRHDNYATIELFYYLDGILADNADNIHNIKDVVGNLDIPELFNKYGDHVIFIRDDFNEIDYRIYQCDREFKSLK